MWGLAAADGAGSVGVTSVLRNVDDGVSAGAPFDLSYAVDAARRLTLGDDDVHVGAVSPDGRFAVVVGGITYGADSQILLLSR